MQIKQAFEIFFIFFENNYKVFRIRSDICIVTKERYIMNSFRNLINYENISHSGGMDAQFYSRRKLLW